MNPGGVRVLRVALFVVPISILFLLLHFVAPGLQTAYRASGLPDGYDHLAEAGNYVVYGRPDNPAVLRVATVLDEFTKTLRAEFGESLHLEPSDDRLEVIVFANHDDFRSYGKAQLGEDLERNGGFYLPGAGALAVIDTGDEERLVTALFHEGTHMMLDRWVRGTDHQWSLWLNEGLATWFEGSFDANGAFSLGSLPAYLKEHLKRDMAGGTWVPVETLIAATQDDYTKEENRSYYAGSCLLVDYLMRGEGGALRERFFRYYEMERRPGPVDPYSFREIVGDPAEVDSAIQRHLWK